MSHQHAFQLFDHDIFEFGPYLRAFDALSDIDPYEHSVLTYIGSLLPHGRGIINVPVSVSILEIYRATKISVSTVRRRLLSLENKGYLISRSVHFKNARGKMQQGANEYLLTAKSFDAYFAKIPVSTNSYSGKASTQNNTDNDPVVDAQNNSDCQDFQSPEKSIEAIVSRWEKSIGIPVSSSEREKFKATFQKLGQPTSNFINRIKQIQDDPKLIRIARNINFLTLPLTGVNEKSDFNPESDKRPDDCDVSFDPTDSELPRNDRALLHAIERHLSTEKSTTARERLEILRETVSCCKFDLSLTLYKKHILHATQNVRS